MVLKGRKTALALVVAGMYLAIGAVAGYATVNALLLLLLGVERYRWDRSRLSVILIAISTLVLIVNNLALLAVIVLISLGTYYMRSKPPKFGTFVSKHRLFLNLRLDERSWVLQSMGSWHAVGEIRIDASIAVPEDKETTIVLQGLVGDVDLIVPEDFGLEVEASVLLGQVAFRQTKESGMFHRLSWRSPDYGESEHKLKLQLFYIVGDIKITTI